MGDYRYTEGSGKNQHTYRVSYLVATVPFPFVPNVNIHHEGLFDKVAQAIGFADINFESAEFSRKFCVRSADKKFAYDACNPQMIDYLLANPGLQIEIQGPVISLAFEPQLPAGNIEFNLQRLIEIRSRLPDYLFTQNA